MSYTAAILPILSALSLAQNKFQENFPHSQWIAHTSEQNLFFKNYYPQKDQLQNLLPQELRSCVGDIKQVNSFLKENGCTIQLKEKPLSALAVASILDIALTWKVSGEKSTLTLPGDSSQNYPAVHMQSGFTIRKTPEGKQILAVDAHNGDTVYMTIAHGPLEGFKLSETVHSLSSNSYEDITTLFSGARFPMVDLHTSIKLDWLLGLPYGDQDVAPYFVIRQALQETRFQMNEKGAHAQSAVAIEIKLRCIQQPKPTFEINEPFYLWIERPSMSMPLFAAYIDTTDWKEPS